MHIALLDTDTPIPSFLSTHGPYSARFSALLSAASSRLNLPLPKTSTYDVVTGELPPLTSFSKTQDGGEDAIDAVLITGSASSAYDNKPWIQNLQTFLRTVFIEHPHVKFFGSCFGHQIIGQALLGSYLANNLINPNGGRFMVEACPAGFEVGIVPIEIDEGFKDAFPRLKGLDGKLRIQLIHGDRVVPVDYQKEEGKEICLPPSWVNVGRTDKCPIQGLYLPTRVLSYQGHFEFDVEANRDLSVAFGERLGWSQTMVEEYIKQVEVGSGEGGSGDDDSGVAAEVVMQFFAE